MKTIATIATTLLLSLGLLVAPASAEEPVPDPAPVCVDYTAEVVQLSSENWALRAENARLRDDLAGRALSEQNAWDRAQAATSRADRLYVEKITLQHRLFALRGELRVLRKQARR